MIIYEATKKEFYDSIFEGILVDEIEDIVTFILSDKDECNK